MTAARIVLSRHDNGLLAQKVAAMFDKLADCGPHEAFFFDHRGMRNEVFVKHLFYLFFIKHHFSHPI